MSGILKTTGQSNRGNDIIIEDENDEESIGPKKVEVSRQSMIGRIRTCNNVSLLEWVFVVISSISIGVGIGFSIYRMVMVPANSDQIVLSILVLVNLLFASFYLFHGIFQEQPFEVLMLLLTTILMWILVTLNYASEEPEPNKIRLIRFLVSTALSLPNVIVGCFVGWSYWSSGNLIFKTVGADMKLQRMCRMLFFGFSLLVFDAQATATCIILILQKGVSGIVSEEVTIIVAGAVFTLIWLLIGYVAMRTENMNLTWLFAIVSIVQPGYVLFLFVQSLEKITSASTIHTISVFGAGAVLIIAHFSLLASVSTISFNYGKGLQEKVYGVIPNTIPPSSPAPGPSRVLRDTDMEPLISSGSNQENYDAITAVAD